MWPGCVRRRRGRKSWIDIIPGDFLWVLNILSISQMLLEICRMLDGHIGVLTLNYNHLMEFGIRKNIKRSSNYYWG